GATNGAPVEEMFDPALVADEAESLVDEQTRDSAGWHTLTSSHVTPGIGGEAGGGNETRCRPGGASTASCRAARRLSQDERKPAGLAKRGQSRGDPEGSQGIMVLTFPLRPMEARVAEAVHVRSDRQARIALDDFLTQPRPLARLPE